MRILLLLPGLFYCFAIQSQSLSPFLVSSAGGFFQSASGSLSVSIGEQTATETVINHSINLVLTQGFQQGENLFALPVKIISFDVARTGTGNQVQWKVINEESIRHYAIERAANSNFFIEIGRVGSVNSGSQEQKYFFLDDNTVTGQSYYRLRITEADGKQWYSRIVKISLATTIETRVYPNPVKNNLLIDCYSSAEGTVCLQILNEAGGLVMVSTESLRIGINQIRLNLEGLSSGIYFMKGLDNKIIKIVKQ